MVSDSEPGIFWLDTQVPSPYSNPSKSTPNMLKKEYRASFIFKNCFPYLLVAVEGVCCGGKRANLKSPSIDQGQSPGCGSKE